MDGLYSTVGVITIVTLCIALIAGCLWLSLYLFGKILKFTGYWKRTLKAVGMVYAEERKAKKK